ncbi:MAG: 50S ribosomal protein L21 [Chloroflexota bacterium]|nr:MAG: 50S ribosomal protein L21 [Chloroflexota bacterium]
MYAVIETGGKQYRVEVGTELEVELLEVSPGDAIKLDRVLLVADGETAAIGRPLVENASVAAEVLRQTRGEKLINFKYGPKTRRRVKKGHRQELTVLRISDIVFGGRSAAKDAAKAAEDRKTERQRLEEAAKRQAEADAALAAKLKPAAPKATKAEATAADAKSARPGRAKAAAKPGAKADAAQAPTKAAAKAAKPAAAKAKADATAKPAAEPTTDKPRRSRATKKDE